MNLQLVKQCLRVNGFVALQMLVTSRGSAIHDPLRNNQEEWRFRTNGIFYSCQCCQIGKNIKGCTKQIPLVLLFFCGLQQEAFISNELGSVLVSYYLSKSQIFNHGYKSNIFNNKSMSWSRLLCNIHLIILLIIFLFNTKFFVMCITKNVMIMFVTCFGA